MNNSAFLRETSLFKRSDALLKVTALLYLKEALLKEEYESCDELADNARNYGAEEGEIREVLAAAVQERRGGPKEASLSSTRKFIKGGT